MMMMMNSADSIELAAIVISSTPCLEPLGKSSNHHHHQHQHRHRHRNRHEHYQYEPNSKLGWGAKFLGSQKPGGWGMAFLDKPSSVNPRSLHSATYNNDSNNNIKKQRNESKMNLPQSIAADVTLI
jgi:hypothetical protein